MKSILPVLAAILLFTFSGCDEGNPGNDGPENLLVVTFSSDYPTTGEDVWIILHDANGAVTNTHKVAKGERVTFENTGRSSDRISVTFAVIKEGPSQSIDLTTFHSVDPGQFWTYSTPSAPVAPTKVGEFIFKMQDPPSGSLVRISNKFDYTEESFLSAEDQIAGPVYDEESPQLISIFPPGQTPKYYLYDEVTKGNSYELAMSSMNDYELMIDVNFGRKVNATGIVKGGDATTQRSDGFLVYNATVSDESTMKLGFANAFDEYATTITASFVEDSKLYVMSFEGGKKTSLITFPNPPSITQNSTDVENFEFVSSSSIRMRASYWNYVTAQASVTWTVYSPLLTHELSLPSDFLAQYPNLQIKGFEYGGSKVYQVGSYTGLINWIFNGGDNEDRFYVSSTDF